MKLDINKACAAWAALEAAVGPLSTAQTPKNAARLDALMHQVLDAMRGDQPPAGAASLLEFLTEWVMAYEAAHVPMPATTPLELLRYLMETNNLKQRDLAAEMGGQPNLSAVLQGRRPINANQAARLGRRFKLSPLAFLDGPAAAEPATQPRAEPPAFTPVQSGAVSVNRVSRVAAQHTGAVINVTTSLH